MRFARSVSKTYLRENVLFCARGVVAVQYRRTESISQSASGRRDGLIAFSIDQEIATPAKESIDASHPPSAFDGYIRRQAIRPGISVCASFNTIVVQHGIIEF